MVTEKGKIYIAIDNKNASNIKYMGLDETIAKSYVLEESTNILVYQDMLLVETITGSTVLYDKHLMLPKIDIVFEEEIFRKSIILSESYIINNTEFTLSNYNITKVSRLNKSLYIVIVPLIYQQARDIIKRVEFYMVDDVYKKFLGGIIKIQDLVTSGDYNILDTYKDLNAEFGGINLVDPNKKEFE